MGWAVVGSYMALCFGRLEDGVIRFSVVLRLRNVVLTDSHRRTQMNSKVSLKELER